MLVRVDIGNCSALLRLRISAGRRDMLGLEKLFTARNTHTYKYRARADHRKHSFSYSLAIKKLTAQWFTGKGRRRRRRESDNNPRPQNANRLPRRYLHLRHVLQGLERVLQGTELLQIQERTEGRVMRCMEAAGHNQQLLNYLY